MTTQDSRRFGVKPRPSDCACDDRFTCGPCLRDASNWSPVWTPDDDSTRTVDRDMEPVA